MARCSSKQIFHRVEDPPGAGRCWIGGKLFHFAVSGDIHIEIRPYTLEDAGKLQRGCIRRQFADRVVENATQHRCIMHRPERKALSNDDGKDFRIDDGSADRVFETANNDRFIDEGILDPAQPAYFRADGRPARRRLRTDEQDFEVGATGFTSGNHRWQNILQYVDAITGFAAL